MYLINVVNKYFNRSLTLYAIDENLCSNSVASKLYLFRIKKYSPLGQFMSTAIIDEMFP